MISKKSFSLFFIGFSLLFFLFGTVNNTNAAIIGEDCNEENSCTDGTYCLSAYCRPAFNGGLGDECNPTEEMPAGTVCSDGISFCYEGKCAEKCVVAYGNLCHTNDPSIRCYPSKENTQVSICKTKSSINWIGAPCGIDIGTFCKKEDHDPVSGEKTCGPGLDFAWRGFFMCSPTIGTETEPSVNLSCCKPASETAKVPCPDLKYGALCANNNGYCYDGLCEPEPGKEVGALCGNDGGTCQGDPGWTEICPGMTTWDSVSGRDCDKTASGQELNCCIDNNYLPDSTCVNKTNGESCGNGGYCYDGICSEFGLGTLDEKCGAHDGHCVIGIKENNIWSCPESAPQRDNAERKCDIGSDPDNNPILCCTIPPTASPTPTPNPINISDFNPTYKACAGTQPREGIVGGMGMFSGSIVPCGRSCDDLGTPTNEMKECTICHFILMGKRIYDLVLSLLIIVSIVMLTASGILYMFSGANPELNSTAKEIVTKTLIGFALFLGSWLIVSTILILISYNSAFLGTGGKWYNFSCDTTSKFQAKDDQGNQSWQNPNNLNIPVN